MKNVLTAALLSFAATGAMAAGHCAAGKTLTDGTLTIATGNPAYYPWVLNDAPEAGEGFEAAVAYALAEEMGFAADAVTWVRTSFDEAIQPGAKNFDLNMQQYSITPERDKVVDFSAPYYTAPQAVMTTQPVVDGGAAPTLESLKGLKWGVVASTTALPVVMDRIQPDQSPLVYDDNANITAAMQAGQIDAALFDLPTALFTAAVLMENGVVLGQFDPDAAENPDQFGMLMPEGSALKTCVDEALAAMTDSGKLAEIEAQWLQEATGVPLIK
ncbi:ABC transporter substrate-binding protein [uncultured Tateyamaria sp.]|uniref:ABC transporter substrate-binding protein n=1 Tax=uncultured Tateyamaria sp. TaxID=455651 RepID=UPI00263609D6|nr:ABC transporter substrate-binding protein [uncultured Tateyamaria sp.]